MNNKIKGTFLMVIFISIVVLLVSCTNSNETTTGGNSGESHINKGQMAPEFELEDLKGNKVSMSDFAGQKVYVKFWASWCPICLAGLEELDQLSTQENDFKVISVVSPNYNGEKSVSDFTQWFEQQTPGHIEVLLDKDGTWSKEFGVRGYPTSYYIGSDGVLVKALPGHNNNENIISMFKEIN